MPQSALARLKTAERRDIILRLKEQGATYEQIATLMHQQYPGRIAATYDKTRVYKDVKACLIQLRETMALTADHVRTLELARLDRLLMPYYAKALQGDHKALDSVLKIQARAAAYQGLDKAPKRDDVLTVDAVMPLLDMVNRAWNDAALALLTPEQQEALFSMVQQRLEATAAAGQSMQALLSGGSEPASSEGEST